MPPTLTAALRRDARGSLRSSATSRRTPATSARRIVAVRPPIADHPQQNRAIDSPLLPLVTSHRKRKKTAAALGLGEGELALAELLEEVLEELRWTRILAYGNQYLLNRFVKIDAAERDRVIEAATRAVEADGKLAEWKERAGKIKQRALEIKRRMRAEFAATAHGSGQTAKVQTEVDAAE